MRGQAATFPAIFSVVNTVLLRPLAYPNADELVSLKFTAPGAPELGEFNMSSTLYLTYLEEARAFENLGLWVTGPAPQDRADRSGRDAAGGVARAGLFNVI
jgi:hypothetical protein